VNLEPATWNLRGAAVVAALVLAAPAHAQLVPPNGAGVTIGHIHLAVKDVEAQRRFWIGALDGVAIQNGPLALIQLPGVYIMLRQAEPTAPPAGSVVDHFGVVLRDLPAALTRWRAAGLTIEQATNPNQGYVHAPDGVRVEFFGDDTLPVPMRLDHIHTYGTDVAAMQAWYMNVFGGIPGQRPRVSTPGWIPCAFFPGFNLSFSPVDTPREPTKGRSLDHIGFEVTDLDAFVRRLELRGVRLDAPPRQVPNAPTRVAFLTDPWGTYIEITEKLAPGT
jgi:catechol 2,3-dioxygenase-like lactoylglutathione lyase family enzyme